MSAADLAANTPGQYRHNGPATSIAAAFDPDLLTGQQRIKVLRMMNNSYPAGVTRDTLTRRLGMLHQSLTARASELKKWGYVMPDPERNGVSATGRKAELLLVTDKGHAALRELNAAADASPAARP